MLFVTYGTVVRLQFNIYMQNCPKKRERPGFSDKRMRDKILTNLCKCKTKQDSILKINEKGLQSYFNMALFALLYFTK